MNNVHERIIFASEGSTPSSNFILVSNKITSAIVGEVSCHNLDMRTGNAPH